MNLQQLEYIVAVDKLNSFSKAAEACYVTQATLSTMVRKLESELEIVLFDRKTNPVITTECGRDIIDQAQKVLMHINRLRQVASEVRGVIEGELNIGVIPTIASNLLHRILPGLMKAYPLLKLNIREITTQNIVEQLKQGELDVGLASTPLGEAQLEEDILYYEKLLVYGDAPGADTRFMTPKDIADEKVWLLEEGNCLTDQVINICALNSKKMNSNLNFSPNSFDSLLNIVDSLNGLTLIPELYCMDLPAERKEKVRDFTSPYPVREISLVYFRPYAKLRLIDAVSNQIKQLVEPILQTSHLKNNEMRIAKL